MQKSSLEQGPGRQATALLRKARKLHETGMSHATAGRWPLALAAFQAAVKTLPTHPNLHYAVGVALCRLDRFDQAASAFRSELQVAPDSVHALAELGICLARNGRTAEALPCLRHALGALPGMPTWRYSLGLALLTENRRGEAIAAFGEAIRLDPAYADAYRSRGLALIMDGKLDLALADFRRATDLQPAGYQAIIDLGLTFLRIDREAQAEQMLELAVEVAPEMALAHYNLGYVLIQRKKLERGLQHIDRALALDPRHPENHIARGFGLYGQGRIAAAMTEFRRAGDLRPDDPTLAGPLLFAMQHSAGVDAAQLYQEHTRWAELFQRIHRPVPLPFVNDPDPARLPRIGIVSADLHRHAVAYLTLRAFDDLARRGYQIVCFSTDKARTEDDFADLFRRASVGWHDVVGQSDAETAALIRHERIDILFDLAGHTAGNRLSLFAGRAAPLQLTWAGYVGTTGLDCFDGLIADTTQVPPGEDHLYSETVIRLPDCYACYQPPLDVPVTALPCQERGTVTFGSFNRPGKLNPAVASVWARILEQVPGSRLLLAYGGLAEASTRSALSAVLSQGGVALDPVEFRGLDRTPDLLAAYGEVDIALDPFPYSGGVTTLEALWMGVPVITLDGGSFAGRHSASHLHASGLDEFRSTSVDQYVACAVDWSRRPDDLARLRASLRDRLLGSPLCDAPRFGAALDSELRHLWQGWCAARSSPSS